MPLARRERVKVPMLAVFRHHLGTVVTGILASLATFVLFYLMTVFALSWGTTALGHTRETFLIFQLFGVVCFALTIPVSAVIAERGRRRMLLWVTVAIGAFGLVMAPLLSAGNTGALLTMAIGLSLMGLTYGPLGTVLSELFPDRGALHRQLADLQSGRHLRRLAGAVHRHLAGEDLRPGVRRVLPDRVSRPDADWPVGGAGDEGRGFGVTGIKGTGTFMSRGCRAHKGACPLYCQNRTE